MVSGVSYILKEPTTWKRKSDRTSFLEGESPNSIGMCTNSWMFSSWIMIALVFSSHYLDYIIFCTFFSGFWKRQSVVLSSYWIIYIKVKSEFLPTPVQKASKYCLWLMMDDKDHTWCFMNNSEGFHANATESYHRQSALMNLNPDAT